MPTPDHAAELLQIPERGVELVKRCLNDPLADQAIKMVVGSGFTPTDVAQALELPWWDADAQEEIVEQSLEGKIKVWECKTPRCKQKGAVSTATNQPDCPSCHEAMPFLMAVDDPDEISHMKRTSLKVSMKDPLARTDKTNAPDHAWGDLGADDD